MNEAPERARGRPKLPNAKSARARSADYRSRLRDKGGSRLTLTDKDFALLFLTIRDSLEHGGWAPDARAELEALRERMEAARFSTR